VHRQAQPLDQHRLIGRVDLRAFAERARQDVALKRLRRLRQEDTSREESSRESVASRPDSASPVCLTVSRTAIAAMRRAVGLGAVDRAAITTGVTNGRAAS
jgi:hypothetical protein